MGNRVRRGRLLLRSSKKGLVDMEQSKGILGDDGDKKRENKSEFSGCESKWKLEARNPAIDSLVTKKVVWSVTTLGRRSHD